MFENFIPSTQSEDTHSYSPLSPETKLANSKNSCFQNRMVVSVYLCAVCYLPFTELTWQGRLIVLCFQLIFIQKFVNTTPPKALDR